MINIAVTGGRYNNDAVAVDKALRSMLDSVGEFTLHVGDATGIDSLALDWANANNVPFRFFVANWQKYGRAAGPLRNGLMLEDADMLLAFSGGRGTANCIQQARLKGIPVILIKDSDES